MKDTTSTTTTAYVGKHADNTEVGSILANVRDAIAKSLTVLRLPEDYRGKHRVKCDSCQDTGLVDWAPFQHRDSEEDQQPCPDCVATRPKVPAS